jgi:hypothetical protein
MWRTPLSRSTRPNGGRAIPPFVAPERHRPRTVHAGGDRRSRPGTGSPRQSTTVGSERAEVHAAERRKDMQTQRLPLARECRGTQTWPDDVLEPVFCEAFEVHDSTARGRPALVFAIRPPAGQQRPFGSCRTQTGARGFRRVARDSTRLSSARPRVGRSSPHRSRAGSCQRILLGQTFDIGVNCGNWNPA